MTIHLKILHVHFMLHVYTHGLYIRTKQILKAVAKTAHIYAQCTEFRVCCSIFVVTVHADYLHVFHVF